MVPAGEDQGAVAFVFGGVRFEDFLQQCVILVFGRCCYCSAGGAAHGRVEGYEVSSSVLAQETKRVRKKSICGVFLGDSQLLCANAKVSRQVRGMQK